MSRREAEPLATGETPVEPMAETAMLLGGVHNGAGAVMKKLNISLKVLIGMAVGIVVGLVLMRTSPVPIQPADTFKATLADGRVIEVVAADKIDAKPPLSVKGEPEGVSVVDADVRLVGNPMADAPDLIGKALGESVQTVTLDARKDVKVRPLLLELIYMVGQAFVLLLRMVVLPLIIATIIVGIASLGDFKRLGRLGGQTIGFYFASMLIAALVGLLFVNVLKPGVGLVGRMPEADQATIADAPTISEMILRIIPANPFKALADFDVLGILFFSILIAIAILHIGKHKAAPVFNFFEGLSDLMFILVKWIMNLAPFGVAGLIAYFIGIQEPSLLGELLKSVGLFAATVASALATHFIILLLIVTFIARSNPFTFLRQLTPAILTALGTNSSNATMPMTLASVDRMGVSKRISGFVVPVGATMNMDGTALFEAVAVMFFAQAYGVDLGLGGQAIIAFTAILAAVGAAGIPSAGLITMAIVLSAVGLPLAGIPFLLGIDRPLDMMRTVVNITGDAVTSKVVQKWNPDIRKEDDDLATEYEIVEPAAAHGP